MRRTAWAWVRVLGGAAILALLVWRLGTGAVLDGLRVIDAGTLAAALAIGALTTLFSAWRWCLVARGLGLDLPMRTAVAAYYRALFLNAALPGGILGDVHRAVSHGRSAGNVGLGVRAVVLERFAGQVVLVTVSLAVLLAAPSPVPRVFVVGAAVVLVAGAGALALRVARRLRALGSVLLARGNWPGITVASAIVVLGHLATFLVAASAAGVTAPVTQLVPLMLLALLAMGVPLNIGGWGPREGMTAWAFGAAGLGAAPGFTVAVVYGLLAFVASLPGALVLVVRRRAAHLSQEGLTSG